MLRKESDVNRKTKRNHAQTALHFAVQSNRVGMVQKLLQKGADPNAQSSNGVTPLQLSIKLKNVGMTSLLNSYISKSNYSNKK